MPCFANSPVVFSRISHGVLHCASMKQDGRIQLYHVHNGFSDLSYGCALGLCLVHSHASNFGPIAFKWSVPQLLFCYHLQFMAQMNGGRGI